MNDSGVAVLSGIAQGIEKASSNLYNISIMKEKMKREKEEFDLNKKVKNAQLKVYEFKTSPEEMLRVKKQEEQKDKIYELSINLKQGEINEAKDKNTKDLEIHTAGMDLFQKFMAGQYTPPPGATVKVGDVSIGGGKKSTGGDLFKGSQQQFRDAINEAKNGNITWEEVFDAYPDKIGTIEKIKSQLTPISKSPEFKEGTGGLISNIKSKFSPHQAELDNTTRTVIDNIKNEYDFEEFRNDIEDYRLQGVDVDTILEYFGKK